MSIEAGRVRCAPYPLWGSTGPPPVEIWCRNPSSGRLGVRGTTVRELALGPLVILGGCARSRRASPRVLSHPPYANFWTGPLQAATVRSVWRLGGSPRSQALSGFHSLGQQSGPGGAHGVRTRRESALCGAPSLDSAVSENTPVPSVSPLIRRTMRRTTTTETVETIEEPLPPVPASSFQSTRPAPEVKESPPAPKPSPVPTSRAWERSQAIAARVYWKDHLGEMPTAMGHGAWEGLTREWGLERFKAAMDLVHARRPSASPSSKYKMLRSVFRDWRRSEGREQDWSRPLPDSEPDGSD